MILKVYTVIESSYRYGDLNDTITKKFFNPESRDKYFDFIHQDKKHNKYLNEYEPNHFDDGGKWSYELEKGEEEVKIIENFDIVNGKMINFKYLWE